MNTAFMMSCFVIILLGSIMIYHFRTEKGESPYTRVVVMLITMLGSFYVGMILEVVLSSLLISMVVGVLTGFMVVFMVTTRFEDLLHGFMQSLMGGMMGGMLSGMIPSENLLQMVQIFSLFVFLLFYLALYMTGIQHRLIKRPVYMAIAVILFGFLLYQIEIPVSAKPFHHD